MADEIDRASDETERTLAEAMRARRPAGPVANGRCHHCDEILDDTLRWCNAGCRDAWELLTRKRA